MSPYKTTQQQKGVILTTDFVVTADGGRSEMQIKCHKDNKHQRRVHGGQDTMLRSKNSDIE